MAKLAAELTAYKSMKPEKAAYAHKLRTGPRAGMMDAWVEELKSVASPKIDIWLSSSMLAAGTVQRSMMPFDKRLMCFLDTCMCVLCH